MIGTKETFIKSSNKKHNDRYDYSKVEYVNNHTKVCIICPEHGEFWQTPKSHIRGHGCPLCAIKYRSLALRLTTEEFIRRAKEIHGDKYDYSKVEYKGIFDKVCVICPIHGEFYIEPNNHLKGSGCKKCNFDKQKKGREQFIKESICIHGNKYDYSKVDYVDIKTKVCIICPIHGEFWQTPLIHLKGFGCKKCSGCEKHTTESFINKAKKIYGDEYDYSKVEYKNIDTKVCIICPKHGEFWVTPNNFFRGRKCPICKESNLECDIRRFLTENNIKWEYEKRFDWLGKQSLDFYLPDYNVAIECQGEQHFYPVNFGGISYEKALLKYQHVKKLDENKKKLCDDNNVKLLYYANRQYNKNIIIDKKIILQKLGL